MLFSGLNKTKGAGAESQKYKTLFKKDNFEIRYYPPAVFASVKMRGTYDEMRNSGFRVLAGYIFGGNEKEMNISMTSPVRMSSSEEVNTMSFIMPSDLKMESLPKPNNENVILHESQPVYAATIQFGGYANDAEIQKMKNELFGILKELKVEHSTDYEYLGYNSPFKMVNRRNEVWVELPGFNPGSFQENLAKK